MNLIKQIAFSENTYVYLLGLALISIPFPYAYSSIALILLSTVSLVHALYKPKHFQWAYLVPMGLFFLMLLSLFWSIDLSKSLRGLERQLPFLLFPLVFWMMPKLNKDQVKKSLGIFAYWMAIFGCIMIFRAFLRYFGGKGIWVFSYHSLIDLFDLNAIYISVMTSLSLLFMLFCKPRNLVNVITMGLLSAFLLLLSSKNIILITALCIIIGLFTIKMKGLKRTIGFTLVLLGMVLALGYGPLKYRWNAEIRSDLKEVLTCNGFTDTYPWTGTSIRLFQARVFFELMQENRAWFTGLGINAVQEKIAEKQNEYELYCGYNVFNFHNQYIQTFAELGILGFLLILGLLYILWKIYSVHKDLFVLFVLIIMTFVFITETYIWRQRGMFHFLLIFGMLTSLYPLPKRIKNSL